MLDLAAGAADLSGSKHAMQTRFSSMSQAFTLMELLVVISVIAILLALIFPAASSVLDNAKRTHAKNDTVNIANAVISYETEYGRLPLADGTSDVVYRDTIFDILRPSDVNSPPAQNPRGIVFIEAPPAKNNKSGITAGGAYMDPWGQAYSVLIDGDYDNQVAGPLGTVRKKVIVWSTGKPVSDSQPNTKPEKFVKSWE